MRVSAVCGYDMVEGLILVLKSSFLGGVKSRQSTTRSTWPRRRPNPSHSWSPLHSHSPPPQRRPPRSISQRGGRRERDRNNREKKEKNTCQRCKLFGRHQAHPNVSESRCNWNKKSKFWRPEWVAKKIGLPYVQRDHFDKAHDGWPDGAEYDHS